MSFSMLTFDVVMPLALLGITLVALFLNRRVEGRLKMSFEEREFRVRDTVLFVVLISVAVSVIVFIPQMALIALFLFSYSSLLFTFSYLFSSIRKRSAKLFCLGFALAGLASGAVALMDPFADSVMLYSGLGLLGLATFAFVALLYEQVRGDAKGRWYLAVMPPILFVLLFFVFLFEKPITYPALALLDIFGAVFAVLITLYLATLFTWKITFVFAVLLTIVDIILVLVTGFMVTAATHVANLGLPVLISLPIIPLTQNVRFLSLGLGDFFFAGTLATQTYKKYGKKTAVVSAVAMTVSFGAFEAFLLSTDFGAFPGTLMIIVGWLLVVAWKLVAERKTKNASVMGN